MIDLKDRTIVVTGAAQGIGRAISELVIELGGNVVAVDLNLDKLEDLREAMPADRVMPVKGSVTDPSLAAHTIDKAAGKFGAVHGLVNNAGIIRPAMIENMTALQWQEVIDVHLTAGFYWLQQAGRHMIQRSKDGDTTGGAIVNISSDAGRKGAIGQINYAAAKSGIFGLTMTAAREWGRYNIRTNTVCFGVVETPMTETIRGEKFAGKILPTIPLGRWSTAAEVAKSVCFLLSDASSYTTGQHIAVNGGVHISV